MTRYHATESGQVPFSAEEEAEFDAMAAQAAIEQAEKDAEAAIEASKLAGIEILGVMCSATKNDQGGLTAIATGVSLARASSSAFPDTRFEFENGNSLIITDSNFNAIYAAWVTFRQSFFAPNQEES